MTAPEQEATGSASPALLRAIRVVAESGARLPESAPLPDAGDDLPTEVVLAELPRILCGSHARAAIDLLFTSGLGARLLPEVEALRQMPVAGGRHKDVYRHTLLVVLQTPPDPLLRLAALLHDIGKPATKTVQGGAVHFPGHAEVGAELARRRLRRLALDDETVDAVTRLVALHLRANSYEDDWTDSATRRLDHDAGDQLERLLLLSRADVTSSRPEAVARALRRVDDLAARIALVRQADLPPPCPLDGHALMALFDRPPGRWIGVVKARLEELIEAGELAPDDTEAATLLARAIVATLDRGPSGPR